MTEWRSIESAPRDGTWVLLYGGTIDYGWDGDSKPDQVVGQFLPGADPQCWQFAWYDSGYYGEYENPTYWKPLDAPASEEPA